MEKIVDYKSYRDYCLEKGDKPLTAFYQILLIQEIEKSRFSFHKKSDLAQHWYILNNLLNEVMGISDESFHRGIYHEVITAGQGIHLSGNEKDCQKCNGYFAKNKEYGYPFGAYQLHIRGILAMAYTDAQAAWSYADNLLILLRKRYGENSPQYAKMKLHITGEFLYKYQRDKFVNVIEKDYEYFKQYTAENDSMLCEVAILYGWVLGNRGSGDYETWMAECEKIVEQKQGDKFYCYYKCKMAWVKAKMLEKQGRNEDILHILKEAINTYLITDTENRNIFYGYVYLSVANASLNIQDYAQMHSYARAGVELCEELGQLGSELYYNLYNFTGIMYIEQKKWAEAEELYSNCIQDIIRKFGIENENYVAYMNNLAFASFNLGRNIEYYRSSLQKVKNKELRKKFAKLFNDWLIWAASKGCSQEDIRRFYQECIKNMEGIKDRHEWIRLDLMYLHTKINGGVLDNETSSLVEKLGKEFEDDFSGEFAIAYWNNRLIWEWRTGHRQTALNISERIMREIQEDEYGKYVNTLINHIHLLALNGRTAEAKNYTMSVLGWIDNYILETGYQNKAVAIHYMRVLLSVYIGMIQNDNQQIELEEKESEQLLEKIIRCKTIEREINTCLGKYEENELPDLYFYKNTHRKLAALELKFELGGMDSEEYETRKMELRLELSKHGANLNSEMMLCGKVREFKLRSVNIPDHAVCVEYFAYYKYPNDRPMLNFVQEENENEIHNYLAFILKGNSGQTNLLDIKNIPLETRLDIDLSYLLEASADTAEPHIDDKVKKTVQRLNKIFAMPVMQYLEAEAYGFLGLDFLLQFMPVDMVFYDQKGKPMNIILVDSACYAGEDTWINIKESDALVIGNPQLGIYRTQKHMPLLCGEIECETIARMCGTKAYTGKNAKQNVLWDKIPKDIIHISTHGAWCDMNQDRLLMGDLVITSYLLFAGYEDWEAGEKIIDYGNGIISGDDFMFMDLSGTKLVVLSACVSGLGYLAGLDTVHGMRWAVGVSGAENSITTLWEVDDDASAVLMVLFYRNLMDMPVGKALYEAKKRLKTITLEELKRDDELKGIIETAQIKQKKKFGAYNGSKPYMSWKHWAAFVCYHR